MALVICSALKTISDKAVNVVAGMIPVDILAKKIRVIYHARSMQECTKRKNPARLLSQNSGNADGMNLRMYLWTQRLILNIMV